MIFTVKLHADFLHSIFKRMSDPLFTQKKRIKYIVYNEAHPNLIKKKSAVIPF